MKTPGGFIYAEVDREDFAHLSAFKWYACGRYVIRRTPKAEGRKTVYLHREIMGLKPGDRREVDHEDLDPLNNRRSNLRVVTRGEQLQNQPGRVRSSRYRGVFWNEQRRRWVACVIVDRRQRTRYCATEDEAARVAKEMRAALMPFATN